MVTIWVDIHDLGDSMADAVRRSVSMANMGRLLDEDH
jgi:hypothetical protein